MMWFLAGLGVALGLVDVYVMLTLWADERNQRFYEKSETRNWLG